MDYLNDTPISRKNKHLNAYERGQIALLHSEGMSAYAIAKRLNRASNTIRNELKRGTVSQIKANKTVEIYFPDTGQRVYENNRKNCGPKFKLLECYNFIEHVIDEFYNSNHSIDSICGSAKLHNKFPNSEMVCTKTLYNYIDAGLLEIKNIDLPLKVKRSSKSRCIKSNKKKLGTSIEERPESINDRSEFGHWEIDTVIGKKTKDQAALLTMTERTTRSQIIRKIADKSSYSVQEAMTKLIKETGNLFSTVFKSITSDNGSEFSELASIEEVVDTKVYYTHPYSSWERGTNERHNGLIRRFIPKGRSINEFSIEAIARVQNWCNTLPRKILGYLTPNEAFEDQLKQILYN
ncbi:IS30 family transposase [Halanaerobium saccharolyticum]|jgi:IS30 family transposase|uniref:IS30 family transposase n=1 Tax=Halanaerobium saccharolyticum TaxID=43595 RepID=A0A4V3G3J9_9FIRM|nr:IS30 family transposase [Halanaerobium saccharolyticum]RAK03907.1 IS30 family transposase [Halanaerobium saccharolyticum]TDV96717.1 IS30 family transposase [Halanaerobium saccharolyticum]TDX48269.1 IS30 family transposase [Halanaerobium saccharolyticum]